MGPSASERPHRRIIMGAVWPPTEIDAVDDRGVRGCSGLLDPWTYSTVTDLAKLRG